MDTEEVVTLLVSGSEFPVSKRALVANSHYFQAMLDGGFMEKDFKRVELQGVENVDAFATVLEFMASGKINWKEAEPKFPEVLQVVDMFCIDSFKEYVLEQLTRKWHEIEDVDLLRNISDHLDIKQRVSSDISSAVWEMFSFLGHECECCKLLQCRPKDIMLLRRDSSENCKNFICEVENRERCSYFTSKANLYNARYCHEAPQLWLAFPEEKYVFWKHDVDLSNCLQEVISLTDSFLHSFLRSPLWKDLSFPQGSHGYKDCEKGFLRWLLQQDMNKDLVGNAVRCFRLECVPIQQLRSLIDGCNDHKPVEKFLDDLNTSNKEIVQSYVQRICIILPQDNDTMYHLDTQKWTWNVKAGCSFKGHVDISEGEERNVQTEKGTYFSISPDSEIVLNQMKKRSKNITIESTMTRMKKLLVSKYKKVTTKLTSYNFTNVIFHEMVDVEGSSPVVTRLEDKVRDVDQMSWFVNNSQNEHLYYSTECLAPPKAKHPLKLLVKKMVQSNNHLSSKEIASSECYSGTVQNCQVIESDSAVHGFVSFLSYSKYSVSHFVVSKEHSDDSPFQFSTIFDRLNVELCPLSAAWLNRGKEVLLLFLHGKGDLWLARYSCQLQALWPVGFLPPLPKNNLSSKKAIFSRNEYLKFGVCYLSVLPKDDY